MRIVATLLCLLALAATAPARATSPTLSDYSDLWWNAAESGWGAHVTLQDDVVFMVLYVYDAQRQARFFVAPNMPRNLATQVQTPMPGDSFTGPLHATQGPPFAGNFNPAQVTHREVGTARLVFSSPNEGELAYTVDGTTITKRITRQAWRPPDLAGQYKGGVFATATASTCPLGLPSIAYAGSLAVTQSGDQLTIDANVAPGFAENGICRFTGRLVQQGSLASITGGTYSCTFTNDINASGTFDLTAIESGLNGFGGRYTALEGAACRYTGRLGGIRRGNYDLPPGDPG